MPVGEYLILFSAILIGLAVADLSLSLHRLLRSGRDIEWHPIVPAFAFIVLCLILNLWWGLYREFSQTTEITFLEFLPQVFMLLTLFLLAAASLPDERLPAGSSLRDYYLDNRRQIWGLVACYLLLVIVNVGWAGFKEGWSVEQHLYRALGNLIGVGLAILLIFSKRMLLHWLMIVFFIFIIAISWFSAPLTAGAAA